MAKINPFIGWICIRMNSLLTVHFSNQSDQVCVFHFLFFQYIYSLNTSHGRQTKWWWVNIEGWYCPIYSHNIPRYIIFHTLSNRVSELIIILCVCDKKNVNHKEFVYNFRWDFNEIYFSKAENGSHTFDYMQVFELI